MKTVLFVCVHNAGRSQMAEALLNHHARARGLDVRAVSAGTQAAGRLNPDAEAVMHERGISLEGHCAKVLNQAMVDSADLVVSMGCGVDAEACPARFLIAEDWGLDDPAGRTRDAVRLIADQIEERVKNLLDGLS